MNGVEFADCRDILLFSNDFVDFGSNLMVDIDFGSFLKVAVDLIEYLPISDTLLSIGKHSITLIF